MYAENMPGEVGLVVGLGDGIGEVARNWVFWEVGLGCFRILNVGGLGYAPYRAVGLG